MNNNIKPIVIGVGSTVADIVLGTKEYIVLHHKNPASEYVFQVGGVIPTALTVLSRLGIPCSLYSITGNDHFGTAIRTAIQQENIDCSHLKTKGNKTPLSVVAVEKGSGERTCFSSHGQFPTLPADTFTLNPAPSIRYLMIDGHNPGCSERMLRAAKRTGIRVVCDLGNVKDGMDNLMRESDILIVPQAYWQVRWPTKEIPSIIRELQKNGPELVVATRGKEGVCIATETDILFQKAFPVKPVNTNSAGDIFLGSFVYGLIQKWTLKKTAAFAAAVAALSCMHMYKDEKIPYSYEKTLTTIQQQGWNID